MIIPFDKEVAKSINVGMNVGMNDKITITTALEEVIKSIIMNPLVTTKQLAISLNKSTRTIDRSISELKELGMLVRIGSKQTGHWKIIKYKNE